MYSRLTDRAASRSSWHSSSCRRAVVEQVIADSNASALAHLPSGHFHANAAWLTLWAMAYNLLRATGTLASAFHTKATTATLRGHLIHVSRQDRPLRPPHHPAPAAQLALAARLDTPVRHGPRTARTSLTPPTTSPARARPEPHRGRAGQTSRYNTSTPTSQPQTDSETPQKITLRPHRWIEAKAAQHLRVTNSCHSTFRSGAGASSVAGKSAPYAALLARTS